MGKEEVKERNRETIIGILEKIGAKNIEMSNDRVIMDDLPATTFHLILKEIRKKLGGVKGIEMAAHINRICILLETEETDKMEVKVE